MRILDVGDSGVLVMRPEFVAIVLTVRVSVVGGQSLWPDFFGGSTRGDDDFMKIWWCRASGLASRVKDDLCFLGRNAPIAMGLAPMGCAYCARVGLGKTGVAVEGDRPACPDTRR